MTAASLALASALAAAATAFSPVAQAQTYTNKPVTLMVGFAEAAPTTSLAA